MVIKRREKTDLNDTTLALRYILSHKIREDRFKKSMQYLYRKFGIGTFTPKQIYAMASKYKKYYNLY